MALIVGQDQLGLAVHESDRGETWWLVFAEKALVEFKLEVMLRLSESVRVVALDQRAVAIGKLIALLLLLLVVWLSVSRCSWLIHDVCTTNTIVLRWLHPRWII